MKSKIIIYVITGCFLFLFATQVFSQSAVGLPFLKIGVGPRQAGMGHVFTGVADDIHTMYWNPGGLGHLRRWQWSAAYNKWFTDVYQASFLYAKQFRAGFSRKATIGFMCSYLGMPSWDATGGVMPAVNANHFVAGVSIGQRLDWLHHSISVGAQVKAIRSNLADYTKTTPAADVGFLVKPGRFRMGKYSLGIFDFGLIRFGASVLHIGPDVTFDQTGTSLPLTYRGGTSLLMGSHNGISLLLASDLEQVKNRDLVVSVGAETWWKNMIGGRIGYQFNDDDLGGLTFGFGFRMHNVINSIWKDLPTRYGDTFEMNIADEAYGDVLNQTYRGNATHYSVAPEPFRLGEPKIVVSQVLGISSDVSMTWEPTIDPDPFDEVSYIVLIDKDKEKVDRSIRYLERDMDSYLQSALNDSVMIVDFTPNTFYGTNVAEGGIYHWAVAAYDLDHHVRLAKKGNEKVTRFVVTTPDLKIEDFKFIYSPWITMTPEQGILQFTVKNGGNAPCDSFKLELIDRSLMHDTYNVLSADTLIDSQFPPFVAEQDSVMQIPWSTTWNGVHELLIHVDGDCSIIEIEKENNFKTVFLVSIPKGKMLVPDSVEVMATGFDSTDVPVVPEVYFDTLSSEVTERYISENQPIAPLLPELTRRVQKTPGVLMKIFGSIDLLSGEKSDSLADERAEAIYRKLLDCGVSDTKLEIVRQHPDKILDNRRRPSNADDAKWVEEQYRKVAFTVQQEHEEAIFGPIKVAVDTTLKDSIFFGMDIYAPGQITSWHLDGDEYPIHLASDNLTPGDSLNGMISWDGTGANQILVPRNRWYDYTLIVQDTLNRTFMTRLDSVYLFEKRTIRKREIFGAAKFAKTEPVYQFYWDRLMDIAKELADNPNMKVRFEGHACAIGPDYINDRLSGQRAKLFSDAFKERVRRAYPDRWAELSKRIEAPKGYGERDPLTIKLKHHGEILLGDNQSPVGRYMNRRIMVLLYREN